MVPVVIEEEHAREVEVMGNEEEAEGNLEDLFDNEPAPAPLLQPLPDVAEQEPTDVFKEHEGA